MDVVKERLEREFNLKLILTVPNVKYHVYFKNNNDKFAYINNPSRLKIYQLFKKLKNHTFR